MSPRLRAARWLAALLMATFSLGGAGPAAADNPDPRGAMIAVLPAPGPHPSLGDQARLFDRFVGAWDCDYAVYADNGSVTRFTGEVLFGWILDGRALQDIWISYPRPGSGTERTIGTSVRILDPKVGTWRVIWVAASGGFMIPLQGGAQGDRIVLMGKDGDGQDLRWSFNDIRPDSFVWRGEFSRDGGKTWRLQEEHHMRRRAAAATPS